MRFLAILILLPVAALAQPVTPASAVTPAPPSRANTLAVEAGGATVGVGVRYERDVGRGLRAGIGYTTFVTGTASLQRSHVVPLTVGAVRGIGGRWGLDAGLGATFSLGIPDREPYEIPGIDGVLFRNQDPASLIVVPSVAAGVRYEGARFYGRAGAAVLARGPVEGRTNWVVLPWPSLSTGVRF